MGAFDNVISTLQDHPWAVGGAVIVGLFLLRGSGGGGGGGTTDYSASLASMQIATDANVALAGIQAQRDAVALQAKRDIVLGAQDYAKHDRTASISQNIALADNSRMVTEMNSQVGLAALQNVLGYKTALKDLENQRVALGNVEILGMADINATREVNLAGIASSERIGIRALDTDLESMRIGLPFQERMHYQEQETVRNLAWRQKQIAKAGFMSNIFGGIIDGGFNLLSKALPTGGIK